MGDAVKVLLLLLLLVLALDLMLSTVFPACGAANDSGRIGIRTLSSFLRVGGGFVGARGISGRSQVSLR